MTIWTALIAWVVTSMVASLLMGRWLAARDRVDTRIGQAMRRPPTPADAPRVLISR
jgi:hypothetical protein